MRALWLIPLCLMLTACKPDVPDTFCQAVAAKKNFCMRAKVDCQKVMLEASRLVVSKVSQCKSAPAPVPGQSAPQNHPEIGLIPCCV